MHIITVEIPLASQGYLEGRLLFPASSRRDEGVVICPPHPLLAGNMDNNVVQAVAQQAARRRPVLIFNYQGVGKSYKPAAVPLFEHWLQLDQRQDFSGVIAESKATLAYAYRYFRKVHLVGYSFGAFIAHHCLNHDCLSFTAITPPLAEHPFAQPALTLPTMVIRAEKDELLASGHPQFPFKNAVHQEVPGTDHFFIKREAEVANMVADFIGA